MDVIEIVDKSRIDALLLPQNLELLEAIDESALGIDGIVTIYCRDEEQPTNMMVVRWAQGSMGLRNIAHLSATTLTGLEEVVRALPTVNAQYDTLIPFWASPALGSSFQVEVQGAMALYRANEQNLKISAVTPQCIKVEDQDLVKPMFRKLAKDTSSYALSLRDQLASVAVVTHLRNECARLAVYTVEESRGRGFGRGVLTALTDELLALKIVPTVMIDLSDEYAVRMVEAAGFFQVSAYLKARLTPLSQVAAPGSLIQLGHR
jgi:hypothetical protein